MSCLGTYRQSAGQHRAVALCLVALGRLSRARKDRNVGAIVVRGSRGEVHMQRENKMARGF